MCSYLVQKSLTHGMDKECFHKGQTLKNVKAKIGSKQHQTSKFECNKFCTDSSDGNSFMMQYGTIRLPFGYYKRCDIVSIYEIKADSD